MAGTQSLHTNSYDEAVSIPTPHSERLALRTQQIIAHESGVTSTIDPLAGSYYVESLTNMMETECLKYFEVIENLGGVIAAVEKGYFQKEIADSAFRYQLAVENKERIIVGLNEFIEGEEAETELREVAPEFERQKIAALTDFKQKREQEAVRTSKEELLRVCQGSENIMPSMIAAVRAGVTLGEAIELMRGIFGRFREQIIF